MYAEAMHGGPRRSMSNRRRSTSFDSGSINLDVPPGDDGASQHDMSTDSESAVPILPPDHVAIRMEGLSREFNTHGGSKTRAVDGLTLDIYEGQVQCWCLHSVRARGVRCRVVLQAFAHPMHVLVIICTDCVFTC